MDIYTFSLALGGAGLGVMALGGLGHHGGQHVGHHGTSHGTSHGTAHGALRGGGRGSQTARVPGAGRDGAVASLLWTLATPRVAFSVLLGFGAAGVVFRAWLGGPLLLVLALVVGVAFERLAVRPLTNLLLGFASAPAMTLESTLLDEARAASGFNARGEGLIAVDLDGQVVQVLGTLRPEDRQLGVQVRAGDRLRIEDVDSARSRCTVSFLGRP